VRTILIAAAVLWGAAAPVIAGDDLGTGIGAKALCESSHHPPACEEQISRAYTRCKNVEDVGRDVRDQCAIRTIVHELSDIADKYNTAQDAQAVERAVRHCVEVVHWSADSDKANTWGYGVFDAFYNSASGQVETTPGTIMAIYTFRKCMAASGVPLPAR
jgi:hypothetical protein